MKLNRKNKTIILSVILGCYIVTAISLLWVMSIPNVNVQEQMFAAAMIIVSFIVATSFVKAVIENQKSLLNKQTSID